MCTMQYMSEPNVISKEEYIKLIENHDQYYMMSDDNRVYTAGYKEEQQIRQLSSIYPDEYNVIT